MSKVYFHNQKTIDQNINLKILSEAQHTGERQVVDINKLLNRVKIERKDRFKKNFILFSILTLAIGVFITLIV